MFRRAWPLIVSVAACTACAARTHRAGGPDRSVGAGPAQPVGSPVLVDEVVAQVQGRAITLSDVEMEIRISRAALGRVDDAFAPVSLEEEADALPELVNWAAVLRNLRSHYAGTLDPRADEREVERMKALFHDPEKWKRFLDLLTLDEDELRERRRRALEAQAIIQAKLADMARLDSGLLEDYLRTHPGITREQAEMAVAKQSGSANLERLLEDARAATNARIVDDLQPTHAEGKP